MKLYEMSVKDFCDEVAKDVPVPGGGSVAALSGAMGVGLYGMVCAMTARKAMKAGTENDYEVANIAVKAEQARDKFYDLIEADSRAFTKVMDAYKLAKGTDEEKEIRKAAVQAAYKEAVIPPMTVAMMAYDMIDCGAVLYYKGDKNALSDVCVGVQCLKTAFWGGIYNVKINLAAIKDDACVAEINGRLSSMESDVERKCEGILNDVKF